MYATAAPPVFSAVDVKSPGQLGDRPRDGQSKISPAAMAGPPPRLSAPLLWNFHCFVTRMRKIPPGPRGHCTMFGRRKQALTRVEAREGAQDALIDWSDEADRNGITEAEQLEMLTVVFERLRTRTTSVG
jgi:hypothetical protein